MLSRITGFFGLLLTLSKAQAAAPQPQRVYTCQYDGGSDAFTWQATGEMAVPPPGAAVCAEPAVDGYHCDRVVDAQGKELGEAGGRGRFCGTDSQASGDYPNTLVYGR
jgi:hypothetical protein